MELANFLVLVKAITNYNVFVKGSPAESSQATIDRFPTLLDASLLNKQGDKLGMIADLIFDTNTGEIIYYLVSRSNPKIPGSSRWRLDLTRISDQHPGIVNSNIDTSIFGTGKFYKEQMEQKKENIYSDIDDMLNRTLKDKEDK